MTNWLQMPKKFVRYTKDNGLRAAMRKTYSKLKGETAVPHYVRWLEKFGNISEGDLNELQQDIAAMKTHPVISVVMPVYNPDVRYLREAIDSVLAQVYPWWELCIADDASPNEAVRDVLRSYEKKDSRIHVAYRQQNGHISAATNTALTLVTGGYVALMDHDDMLPNGALYFIAREIDAAEGAVDLIYTDEDKIDGDNRPYDPYFKADWDPVMILSQNFVAHLGVYRTELLRAIGGFRDGYEGSQDYDMLLRFLSAMPQKDGAADERRIRHIPRVLYHWRIFPGNHTFSTDHQDISDRSAKASLTEYFAGHPEISIEKLPSFPGCWRIRYTPKDWPRISIIIPTKDKADVLKRCVASILAKTDYPGTYEVLIVDNASEEPATKAYYESLKGEPRVRVLHYDQPFNYAAINNFAAAEASGDAFLFLNNDTEVLVNSWLRDLVSSITRPGVGIAGAKLCYPDGRVQHCGVTLGIYGVASHTGRGTGRDSGGYFGWMALERCVSAVTGACMLVRREAFEAVHGFDAATFAVSYNDVDLCLRVGDAGWRVVVNPAAELTHYESVSRGADETPAQKALNRQERHAMYARYGARLHHDPHYNPNLTLENENFELAAYPRIGKPWRPWKEFVCPFHRGDVLLGLQAAMTAHAAGQRVRMHVSRQILPWILDVSAPFPIVPVSQAIPKAGETYLRFQQAEIEASDHEGSSGRIIGSHPAFDFDFLGLDIVENMLHAFELPLGTKLESLRPAARPVADKDLALLGQHTLLIHPYGGWHLKSLPGRMAQDLIALANKQGFHVIQIGGAGDAQIAGCDGYLLRNENLGWWRTVFEHAAALIGVDSWTSHFAALLDTPQITLYGTTTARDVSSKAHFRVQHAPALLCDTTAPCSPCHKFQCEKGAADCLGFSFDEAEVASFLDGLIAPHSRKDSQA
ncbi:glycosyltransferase [uncultured Selenomonas sp.]|uniref:glycosyltransferase n=1 Tax=uncultured Selenomonas sp. TaxID=159275 RepID=UPI0025DE6CD6|nr:glycosyltransferase [uncultured Selenomonas sp.]